ncbi:hypothetical protein BWI97_20125 [Siphonobacter sp. BAB-5405]|uniref:tetratricopeptide repeat protein n=1 Tax=Siphonobacter sp. BAB-5405 TaxID=1864825 RepID=UPI000C805D1E|nr:tetratricopeptide repeat protein [Siphonobacter sp. BAB-5405]PMD92402.1 hypothetical protein BWI97_20125 [Siphonobacter sp. BAB-5405]
MESNALDKARLLMNLNRTAEAIQELRQWLLQQPEDLEALVLLVQAYINTHEYPKALETAEELLSQAPDYSIAHYFHGVTLLLVKRYTDAEQALLEAVELDPWDADYFNMLGTLHNLQKHWEKALFYADQGLAIDPEHVQCLNTRTEALTKLGRLDEMQSTIEETLAADPHNAYTQATVGWSKLERGNISEARQHFAEALRMKPTYEFAQEGMKEAVKAKNPLYRAYLNYSFWMSRHQSSMQWSIILGVLLGQNLVRQYAERFPVLNVLLVLIIGFLYFTWVMMPVGYLILQLDSYGRMALEKNQKRLAWITGIALCVGVLSLAVHYWLDYGPLFLLGMYGLLVIIPLSRLLDHPKRIPTWLKVVSWLIIGLGALAVLVGFVYLGLGLLLGYLAFFGVLIYSWLYNFALMRGA